MKKRNSLTLVLSLTLLPSGFAISGLTFASPSNGSANNFCSENGYTHQVKCCYRLGALAASEALKAIEASNCRAATPSQQTLTQLATQAGCDQDDLVSIYSDSYRQEWTFGCR